MTLRRGIPALRMTMTNTLNATAAAKSGTCGSHLSSHTLPNLREFAFPT